MVNNKNFKGILKAIERINGVKECLVATMDGMPMGTMDPDSSLISATSAAALGAVSEMMKNLEYGDLEQLIVETDYGRVIMEEIENEYALIVIANNDANIGMIRIMLKKALKECHGKIISQKQDLYYVESSLSKYPIEEAFNGINPIIRDSEEE